MAPESFHDKKAKLSNENPPSLNSNSSSELRAWNLSRSVLSMYDPHRVLTRPEVSEKEVQLEDPPSLPIALPIQKLEAEKPRLYLRELASMGGWLVPASEPEKDSKKEDR